MNLPSGWRRAGIIAAFGLRQRAGSLLAFCATAAFFHALVAGSFPAIGGAAAVAGVVQIFPQGLRTLLRIAPNLQAGFGLQEYLAFSWFHPLFLGLGAAFVVSRASQGLAQAVENGSIYLILSRPVPRWSLVLGRGAEMILGAALLAGAGWVGLALGLWLLPEAAPSPSLYAPAAVTAALLFGALGAGALCISALTTRSGQAAGWGSAWTLAAFALDIIPAVADSPLGWLNPWHHYFPQELIAAGRPDLAGILVLTGWILIGTLTACLIFGRRDLA